MFKKLKEFLFGHDVITDIEKEVEIDPIKKDTIYAFEKSIQTYKNLLEHRTSRYWLYGSEFNAATNLIGDAFTNIVNHKITIDMEHEYSKLKYYHCLLVESVNNQSVGQGVDVYIEQIIYYLTEIVRKLKRSK